MAEDGKFRVMDGGWGKGGGISALNPKDRHALMLVLFLDLHQIVHMFLRSL